MTGHDYVLQKYYVIFHQFWKDIYFTNDIISVWNKDIDTSMVSVLHVPF